MHTYSYSSCVVRRGKLVFVQVATGDSASFALTDDELVYGWGSFVVSSQTFRYSILAFGLTDLGK